MRIGFLGLHAFVAIAERGSFQLAAAHLNLSQTALGHRIIPLTFGSSSMPKTDGPPVRSRRRASP
jgi:hypothetical protein